VNDSRDRYANIEVSYLLQRMEAYRGLAILTTNLKSVLDAAFLRRLRFVVQFPFPDSVQRERIWRGAFPVDVPLGGIDHGKLSQLNVAGGSIRNIALNACFLAADEGSSVGMSHLLRAARSEATKRDRPFSDAETRGWQ
jgi:SpoVK/Ycf46/Vps4 family AAA+-type ATPase